MEPPSAKRARLATDEDLTDAGHREIEEQTRTETPSFKVPTLIPKPKTGASHRIVGLGLTGTADDDLGWLASAGTDATQNIPKPAAAAPLQLNSEESSLIARLLGQKSGDDDVEDTGKRYFGQNPKAGEQNVEKKEDEDVTAQLVYDDENDELETFLQEKITKPSTAPPAASSPASSISPLHFSPPKAAGAAVPSSSSVPSASSVPAANPPVSEAKEDKKAKSKSSFKF